MPDLLAHALLAYAVCTVLSWRYGWITPAYVTAGVVGAFVPDLAKAHLAVPSWRVAELLSVPFEWSAIHTAGGSALALLVGVVLARSDVRRRVLALLALGAGSHLLADALLLTPTGRSYPLLWPLTGYVPPTPGLYLSTEPGPTLVAATAAVAVRLATPRVRRRRE